jgi:hypothetical protein
MSGGCLAQRQWPGVLCSTSASLGCVPPEGRWAVSLCISQLGLCSKQSHMKQLRTTYFCYFGQEFGYDAAKAGSPTRAQKAESSRSTGAPFLSGTQGLPNALGVAGGAQWL